MNGPNLEIQNVMKEKVEINKDGKLLFDKDNMHKNAYITELSDEPGRELEIKMSESWADMLKHKVKFGFVLNLFFWNIVKFISIFQFFSAKGKFLKATFYRKMTTQFVLNVWQIHSPININFYVFIFVRYLDLGANLAWTVQFKQFLQVFNFAFLIQKFLDKDIVQLGKVALMIHSSTKGS